MRSDPFPTDDRLVWVTRSAPYNRLTGRRLRSAGHHPLLEPALRIIPTAAGRPIAVPAALVFTSLQGVRIHHFFPSLASLPVFTVGDRSARFARLRGYRTVYSASGDVSDLRKLIRETMHPGSEILHFSAVQPAGDLLGMLRGDGFVARRQCVYEAVEASVLDLEWVAGKLGQIDTILIHSPRAARHVSCWLHQQLPAWQGRIICISSAAAAAFDVFKRARTVVAARPNEADLMAAL